MSVDPLLDGFRHSDAVRTHGAGDGCPLAEMLERESGAMGTLHPALATRLRDRDAGRRCAHQVGPIARARRGTHVVLQARTPPPNEPMKSLKRLASVSLSVVRGSGAVALACVIAVALAVACDDEGSTAATGPAAAAALTATAAPSPTAAPTPTAPGTPNWVFAGDVPEAERTALREEMEAVRTWFYDQYGVVGTDLTVLVGTDAEALAPEFRDVVGDDLSGIRAPPGHSGPTSLLPDPFVATADDGNPVIVAIYGNHFFDSIEHAVAHEYFHVLQHQILARGDHRTSEVLPYWLVEGTAMYADYAYSPSRSGRPPFFERYTPYRDLGHAINLEGAFTPRYLESIATASDFRGACDIHPIFTYSLAFAGTDFLVGKAGEDSIVEFWKSYQQLPTWQQAFEGAFGMGIEDFYDSFSEWLPSQLPSYVQLAVRLHWPGKEALSPEVLGPLRWNTGVHPENVIAGPSSGTLGSGSSTRDGAHTIVYDAGESWTGGLSLWFLTDECKQHLLGWYKDGELTTKRAEATVMQFHGESSSLDWTIPARPDTLPRLLTRSLCN